MPYRFEDATDPEETHRYGGTHAANARGSARAWQTAIQYLDRALSKTDASV